MSSAIEVRQLSKTYVIEQLFQRRRVTALQDLNLTIAPGQVYGLLGPNGAGKSTTIKILLNLVQPSSGQALVFGRPPSSSEARRLVGYLPENPAPYEYLTGREFVAYSGQLHGLQGRRLDERVDTVIDQVRMKGPDRLQVRRYSKGMLQRISLAQALVAEPRLLILDEPTSGLDVLGRQLIRDLVTEERRRGTTVLLCSHIIPDVEALCDHVAVLVGGKLVTQGRVSDLLAGAAAQTEVTLEGLSVSVATQLQVLGVAVTSLGTKGLVHCDESQVGDVLKVSLTGGARVVSLQRTRYSLEDMFLEALKDSGGQVGGQLE